MKLYVDDVRRPPEGWTVVRTIGEAIRILRSFKVEEISLDHDIFHQNGKPGYYCSCVEDFKPVAYYLAIMPEAHRPKVIRIHTANWWAAKEMRIIFEKEGIETIRTSPSPDHPRVTVMNGGIRIDKET